MAGFRHSFFYGKKEQKEKTRQPCLLQSIEEVH